MYTRTTYKGKPAKLEIFNKNHKLFRSLPVHREALKAGLRVPKLYAVERKGNKFYKYTEWVKGNTIKYEMDKDPKLIKPICRNLACYINELYDIDHISPVDNHLENFVWCDNQVIYIDLKKLLHRQYENHIVQMTKLCLKNFKTDRKKIIYFLRSYSNYRTINPILEECNRLNWKWFTIKTKPIKMKEILDE